VRFIVVFTRSDNNPSSMKRQRKLQLKGFLTLFSEQKIVGCHFSAKELRHERLIRVKLKDMAEENLGLYVMTRRKGFGFKQSDLANALGYTSQAISKFESGESQIALEVLPKLANLLSLSLDDLLLENPNPAPFVQPNPDFSLATVKANLIAFRANALLSQEQEAAALGVSKRSIVSYEQGISYPSFYCLSALLHYYQIKPSAFLPRSRSPRKEKPSMRSGARKPISFGSGALSSWPLL
jgi:transcriptional regulator with XRE-family HTH domain